MAGALRKTMVYLGLAEDDERYDNYDDFDEPSGHHDSSAREDRAAGVTAADRPLREAASCPASGSSYSS